MAKTKAEIRKWLESQVGKKVKDKSNSALDGQCVALGKALMEFIGVPNPYAARGNAKDVGDTLVRQGIAQNKDGWLRVCINRNMGGGYGHYWIDLKNEANYEQNGARALHVTKGTRPISQAGQIVNLDKYIKADAPKKPAAPTRKSKKGTATVTASALNVRTSAEVKSNNVAATYNKGQRFTYDSYIKKNGYTWLSYVSYSGKRRYVAQASKDGKTKYVKGGV